MESKVILALSNRHCHLSEEHVEALFGKGYELTHLKDLVQPGQYATEEQIEVVGKKGNIKMRVLGPTRKQTQVEILAGDAFKLGVPVVVRDSGDLSGTPGITLKGPAGEVTIDEGVIVACRHIHMSLDEAKAFGVKDKDIVKVRVDGERAVVFENVLIRANENFSLEMHVDLEEGNACGGVNGQMVTLIRPEDEDCVCEGKELGKTI